MALDIGVTSPETNGTDNDCCETLREKKRHEYEDYDSELQGQNIYYKSLSF